MPGRYIREGLLDSERFDALRLIGGAQAQLFFTFLLLVVDDYGRAKNHPIWIRSKAFPLRDDIREADISRWITACEKSGLIALYGEPSGTAYIQVFNFGQQARSKSKCPEPPAEILHAMQDGSYQRLSQKNSEKHCKTMFSPNDNGNDNDNDNGNGRRAPAPEIYPQSADEILEICATIKSPMTKKQAQSYFDQRSVADWHQGAGGTGRKIRPENIPADIRRWIDRDKAEAARQQTSESRRLGTLVAEPQYSATERGR